MIIFLHGADTFSSRRKLHELKQEFIKKVDTESNSLTVINGENTSLKELGEKINTGSLFVKKRLIIIENIFHNKKEDLLVELVSYFKKFSPDNDTIIIFWDEELNTKKKSLKIKAKKLFAFLDRQVFVQEFKPLTNNQLLTFVKKEAKLYDKDINLQTASTLINTTNGDLWTLSREIKKLSCYKIKEKTISSITVKKLVASSFNENIFALTDALSAKNKMLAIKLLEEQFSAGLNAEYLLTMLIRQFKILLQIKVASENETNQSTIAKRLKLHPFIIKKGILQAKNFDKNVLTDQLNHLIHLDFLNKNGLTNLRVELTLLISGL